jgi:hypothetical protein
VVEATRGLEPFVSDSHHLIFLSTYKDFPITLLRGQSGEKRKGRAMITLPLGVWCGRHVPDEAYCTDEVEKKLNLVNGLSGRPEEPLSSRPARQILE